MPNPCEACGGDGVLDGDVCPHCEGTGIHTPYIPGLLIRSYKVLETIDSTEYNALTAAKKDGLRILLSCGLVDMNEGKAGKVRLWGWFGEGTTTRAALETLIGE